MPLVSMGVALRSLVAAAVLLTACSSDGSPSATAPAPTTTVSAAPGSLPRVEDFFEINATSSLVNLIVSLNDGKVAQPWVYFDGALSSTEGAPADGFSFPSSALDFDPEKVLSQLQGELPNSNPDLFFIEGGKGSVVRYSVVVTSSQGGQLIVVVGPDGTIQSVEAG